MSADLTDEQVNELARPLSAIIESFYKNSENERRFQEWLSQGEENDI